MTAINSNRAIRGPVTAVPVVAGKGVRLVADTENNRWVVEADETVLWEGTAYDAGAALTMSENCTNFEKLQIYGYAHEAGQRKGIVLAWPYAVDTEIGVTLTFSTITYSTRLKITTGGNMSVLDHINYWKNGSAFAFGNDGVVITKVVGIHRIASN